MLRSVFTATRLDQRDGKQTRTVQTVQKRLIGSVQLPQIEKRPGRVTRVDSFTPDTFLRTETLIDYEVYHTNKLLPTALFKLNEP